MRTEHSTLFLTGDIDFNNVMSLCKQGLAIFKQQAITTVDLASVTSHTSSVIALLIEWRKAADFQVTHLPTALQQIAGAAGLMAVLDDVPDTNKIAT